MSAIDLPGDNDLDNIDVGSLVPPNAVPPKLSPPSLPAMPAAPAPAMQPQAAPNYRQFSNAAGMRKAIFDNALNAAKSLPEVANNRYRLRIADIAYADPEEYSLAEQKKALLTGGALHRRLQGTWVLSDVDGNEVSRKRTTLAKVPYMTNRGVFISGGNNISFSHQLRLKPGAYTRVKANGELEAHVNVKKGPGHKLFMDPETGIFKLSMNQANIPLVPILKAMGVSDKQIRDTWGNELAAANLAKDDPQAVRKLYAKLSRNVKPDPNNPVTPESTAKFITEAFNRMELDPEVSQATLGAPHTNLTSDAILGITKKLIAVSRKEAEADDRDAMPYQTLHGPDDIIAERIARSKGTLNRLLWKAAAKGEIGNAFTNALDDDVRGAMISSGLAMPIEEVNLAEILDHQSRVTRMGEGGIESAQAVPEESRSVHPSQLGFIDFLRTPECFDEFTQVLTSDGWKYWAYVKPTTLFATLMPTGPDAGDWQLLYNKATALFEEEYSGKMYVVEDGDVSFYVTPKHRLFAAISYDGQQVDKTHLKKRSVRTFIPEHMGKLHFLCGTSENGQDPFRLVKPAPEAYHKITYQGKIYCATVPGGLLYVRRKNEQGHWSGNSGKVGVDARLASAAMKGDNNQIVTPVKDMSGNTVYMTPRQLAAQPVAFAGELNSSNRFIKAIHNGKIKVLDRSQVQYAIGDAESSFSPLANMIPGKSAVKGQRAIMASRMVTQALPLLGAEAPLVQSGTPDNADESFEERYGTAMGAVKADQPGFVESVTPDGIVIRQADGTKKTVELASHLPTNRKTFLHQTPVVGPGDRVDAGQLLATSNFTDNKGTTALGLNTRVAYYPFDGHTFEDANAISESYARRLTSTHMYKNDHEWAHTDKRGKSTFVGLFPGKYSKDFLSQFHDDGTVKVGTVVKQGDPLILVASQKERNKQSMVRSDKPVFKDSSVVWDHHDEGVVTDVVHTEKGTTVVVKANRAAEVGDKLCFSHDTYILTKTGYKLVSKITKEDWVATLNKDGYLEWQQPTHVWEYDHTGDMYQVEASGVDQLVTLDHELWASIDNAPYAPIKAKDLFELKDVSVRFQKDFKWKGKKQVTFTFADSFDAETGQRVIPPLPMDVWLEFLGVFISCGTVCSNKVWLNLRKDLDIKKYVTDLIEALGFEFNFEGSNEDTDQIRLDNPLLVKELSQSCVANFFYKIPEYVQSLPAEQIIHFLDALMEADPEKKHMSDYSWIYQQFRLLRIKAGQAINPNPEIKLTGKEAIVPYDGKVYCVTVPNHTVYMLRGFDASWSCNSGRYGDKGVISKIIPDEEMPVDEQGRPFELLTNPLGLTSRVNPMQIVEAALGKIAAVTGKAYKLQDFNNIDDIIEFAHQESQKHGIKDLETVTDPRTGRKIPEILAGNRWFMKLHHMAEDKIQGRGLGSYTAEGQPAGKTEDSDASKRLGMLEVNALLSHGATGILRQAKMLRGQANPEYWSQYMSGHTPNAPEVPWVYSKFINSLKASGINPVRGGTRTQLMPLTDKHIDELVGDRELKNAETVDWKTMEPIEGGLFDRSLTGGHGTSPGGGSKWAFIKLHEPMPNPVMEEPIRRILGLTKNKFEDILARKADIGGEKGPQAIQNALKKIDLDQMLHQTREDLRSTRKTKRDEAVRKLGYLKTAKDLGIHPSEWMVSKVPVLPPAFRPVTTMGNKKLPLVDDANYLYKEIHDANNVSKQLSQHLDPDDYGDATLATYNAFRAVTGLGDPIQAKNQERNVRGILKHVFGSGGPKTGMLQRKLLGSTTDLVARGVITPDANLEMDQIGIPEDKAWDMYTPMLVRRLVRRGMSRMDAMRAVEARSQPAKQALSAELEDAVVLMNRAPTLHRYGIMAHKPVLTKGNTIKVSPLVVGGYGADFDGDSVNIHALSTLEEKKDAIEKMLPSKNLFNVAEFKTHQLPSKEFIIGLYEASKQDDANKPPLRFESVAAALAARDKNLIPLGRRIEILTDD